MCEADSSSGDVVLYWIITDTHIVPDRQQYDHVDKSPKVYTQLAREGVVLTQDSDNI